MSGYYKRGFVKRDANHSDVAQVLESFGFSQQDTSSVGSSFPDIVAGFGGMTWMIEVKNGKDGSLSDGQKEFALKWRGTPVVNLLSKAEAIEWATRTRHELRRRGDAKALAACVHRHREEDAP